MTHDERERDRQRLHAAIGAGASFLLLGFLLGLALVAQAIRQIEAATVRGETGVFVPDEGPEGLRP